MEPLNAPMETVDATGAHRAAAADSIVVDAWTDHHEELFAFLVRMTRDAAIAEDLLQESFLRLTREVRAGRQPDNARAWLYRVAANLAVSRGRRVSAALRGLVRVRAAEGPRYTDFTPETSYLQREGRDRLVAVLANMRPDARAALLLSSEGFSGEEIAAAIGRTDAATRALLCRTRIEMRRRLEMAEALR